MKMKTRWLEAVDIIYSCKCHCCSVTQSCLTLCDPMDCSKSVFPVFHHLPEIAQKRVHWVGDAIQPPRPLSSPSPPVFNLSQRQRCAVLRLVTQLCLTLCDPMDCSPPGSSVHGDSPGKNTGVCCHALLQGIFPIQGSNPGLWHCRRILYCLSHQGSPEKKARNVYRNICIWHFSDLESLC